MPENPRIEELRRRVQKDPASIAFAQLAEEYRRAGSYADAIETCRTGLQTHPGYLSARVTLGRALIEMDELGAAQSELEYVLAARRGESCRHSRHGRNSPPPRTPERGARRFYKSALDARAARSRLLEHDRRGAGCSRRRIVGSDDLATAPPPVAQFAAVPSPDAESRAKSGPDPSLPSWSVFSKPFTLTASEGRSKIVVRLALRDTLAVRQQSCAMRFVAAGLDGLIVTHLPNLFYLTNFLGTAGIAVVTARSALYLIVDFRYGAAVNELQASAHGCPDAEIVPVDRSYDETLVTLVRTLQAAALGVEGSNLSDRRFNQLHDKPSASRRQTADADRVSP